MYCNQWANSMPLSREFALLPQNVFCVWVWLGTVAFSASKSQFWNNELWCSFSGMVFKFSRGPLSLRIRFRTQCVHNGVRLGVTHFSFLLPKYPRFGNCQLSLPSPIASAAISSIGMTVPSAMTRVFSGTEMCRTRPVTVTYALPVLSAISSLPRRYFSCGRRNLAAFSVSSTIS